MCSQRERQKEMGDDYIPGNKCGLSTAGIKMLSGVAVAYGLEDVSGLATPLNCICAHIQYYLCVCGHMHQCMCVAVILWIFLIYVDMLLNVQTITALHFPSFVNIQFVANTMENDTIKLLNETQKHLLWLCIIQKNVWYLCFPQSLCFCYLLAP